MVQAQVEGLTRTVECTLRELHFASPRVGYAVGDFPSYEVPGAFAVVKTTDGGTSWTASLVEAETSADEVFFLDESTGFVRLLDGKVMATRDGGATWQGIVASAGERIRFADPEVGWSFLRHTSTLSYTTDGGRRWTTREIGLPAMVTAFAFPRRDRAYAVGDHGMIYRYRVVPIAEAPQGAVEAPLMSGVQMQ